MTDERTATEQRPLDEVLQSLDYYTDFAQTLLARLRRMHPLPEGSRIVEIGCAQGGMLIAMRRLGFDVVGIEPWRPAVQMAAEVAAYVNCPVTLHEGMAENLPLEDNSCDCILANNVIEHVQDAEQVLAEVARVLKPGGVFWFSAASSISVHQKEISRFPLFGWYPDRLKRKIMVWAHRTRPHLVGHTSWPAIHWFTPRKARRMLTAAGFTNVQDRWRMRLPSEGGRLYRAALWMVQKSAVVRLLADAACEGCAYAAIKK